MVVPEIHWAWTSETLLVMDYVEGIAPRAKAKKIAGDWAGEARSIAQQQALPALQRQLDELKAQRAIARSEPGM